MIPNSDFNDTPLFDVEYLRNDKNRHMVTYLLQTTNRKW